MSAKGLFLPADLASQMRLHAQQGAPEEVCGLVGGQAGRAMRVIAVENCLHSPVRFRMDAAAQLQAMLDIEAAGLEMLAIYHSHPQGPPVPSPTDVAEFAYPGVLTLIWSPGAEPGWQVRAFEIGPAGSAEVGLYIGSLEDLAPPEA